VPHTPTVSVIVPTFNRQQWTRAAVDSVRAQSLPDWELLIADDGSDAETRDYLRDLAGTPRVGVQFLPHGGKPATARNAALRRARGEYVAFLDSDDVWLPGKLESQLRQLRARRECAWGYTAFTLIDANGEPLEGSHAKTCPAIEGPFLEPLLRGQPLIRQSTVIVRRELLETLGGYDEGFTVCEDYDLFIRLAQRSPIAFLDEPLVRIRLHGAPYFDEVTAWTELSRMFDKLWHSGSASPWKAVLRERRARAAAGLALAHAERHERLAYLGTLLGSVHRSWPYRCWWSGALRATARAFLPGGVIALGRAHRRGRGP